MTRREKQQKKKKEIAHLVQNIIGNPVSATDPLGSFTGNAVNKNEQPQQDADDL